jgi:16S rRNA (cytosine967-C5)-methyltransferase
MNPRQLAIQIIKTIDEQNAYVDIAIDNALTRVSLPDSDRRLVHELVSGTIRQRKKLEWSIQRFFQGKLQKAPPIVRLALEISCYQLLFLSRLPHYAVINEGVEIVKKQAGQYWGNKVNAILRSIQREKDHLISPDVAMNTPNAIATHLSHPEWLITRWISRFGVAATHALCVANNQTPEVALRVDTCKTAVDDVLRILEQYGSVARRSAFLPEFIIVSHLTSEIRDGLLDKGLVSVQDESAGFASHLIDPQAGELIYDLCAAPGGKTTHIGEIGRDQAFVVAVDSHHNRLLRVRENKIRIGIDNIGLVQADAVYFQGKRADKILLDVPCSGLGVLAKRVDLRWRRTAEDITAIARIQTNILNHAATLAKPGGVIVYSTCTIEPEENENVIESFLVEHSEFRIENPSEWLPTSVVQNEKYVATYPHIHNTDGAFAVRLRKIK